MRQTQTNGRRRRAAAVLLALALLCGPLQARDRIEDSGDVLYAALPLAALAMTVKRRDRDGRFQLAKSFGAAGLTTGLLKEVIDKERPNGKDDTAFPSGHTSAVFLGAGFLHRRYGIREAWPAYVLATYTAWTRVYAHQHDTADVLAGAAVGFASAWFLSERMPRVEVTPLVGRATYGLQVSASFGSR